MKKIYKVYNIKDNSAYIIEMFTKDFIILFMLSLFLVLGGLSGLNLESLLGSSFSAVFSVTLYLCITLLIGYLLVDILYMCVPVLEELNVIKLNNTIVYNNERSKVIRVKRFISGKKKAECRKLYNLLSSSYPEKLELFQLQGIDLDYITSKQCGVIQYLYDNKKMKRV